jgi:PAS domain S-box-containing protein
VVTGREPRATSVAGERLLDALPVGVAVFGPDGRVTSANAALLEMFGADAFDWADYAVDDPRWNAVDAQGRPLRPEAFPAVVALREGRAVRGRVVGLVRPSGEPLWLELDAVPLDDGSVVVCAREVSAQRAAQRHDAVRAQLLDAVGQAVIATDLSGRVTYWNRAAEDLYGWTAEEALGHDVLSLTPSEDQAEQAAEIMSALGRGEAWSGRFTVRRKDGSRFSALVTDAPVHDETGMLVGVVGVSADLAPVCAPPPLPQPGESRATSRRRLDGLEVLPEHGLDLLRSLTAGGSSPASTAAALNAAGFRSPSGRRWHPSAVRRAVERLADG